MIRPCRPTANRHAIRRTTTRLMAATSSPSVRMTGNCPWKRQRSLRLVAAAWEAIPGHISGIGLDAFVVMPNHVHGILTIQRTDPGQARPLPGSGTTVGHSVRSFKPAVTRELRQRDLWDGTPFWQAGFYDRVIRDKMELDRIRAYIENDPAAWLCDWENPNRIDNPTHRQRWNWLETPPRP